jgi:hypothetical protein
MSELVREIETIAFNAAERAARRVFEECTPTPKDWLKESELAELWGCSTDTIRAYAMREKNPLPYGSLGETRRYHRADFDRWAREEGERDRSRRAEAKRSAGDSKKQHRLTVKK